MYVMLYALHAKPVYLELPDKSLISRAVLLIGLSSIEFKGFYPVVKRPKLRLQLFVIHLE